MSAAAGDGPRPLGAGVTCLALAADWVAVGKPAGLPVIPTREDPGGPTLQGTVARALGERLFVVHRLDRDTSGVVVLARSAEAHRRLNDAFAGRRARKTYLALCRRARADAPTAGRVDLPVAPGRKGGMRVVTPAVPGAGGARAPRGVRPAVTRFRVVALEGDLAVIEAHPETGRTHQIRVHLAAAGWPLAVDPRYGDPGPVAVGGATCPRLTLHARRLVLEDAGLDVTAPVPPDLAGVLAALLHRPLD